MIIPLSQFKNQIDARNPGHVNRQTDCCDWFFGDLKLFHERSHWPCSVFSRMFAEFWSQTIYTDLFLINQNAKQFGGIVQKSWYCDDENPTWFLIFNDFDKAVEYSYYILMKQQ